jgi:MinD-like ATPase involved in chromosome partitioning or flagellar assembly
MSVTPTPQQARRSWPPGRRFGQVASWMLTSSQACRQLAELATAVQRPVTTGRRIAVTSVHRGAGTSVVAALLASVYAARRADAVLAVDADPDGGSLASWLGLPGTGALATLAPRILATGGADLRALQQILPRTATGLWVLPGGAPEQPRLVRDVTRVLSRLFAVSVTDCAGGMHSPAAAEVLEQAHAVVVVTPATPEGLRSTCDALDLVAEADRAASLSRVAVALATSKGAHRLSAAVRNKVREAFGRYGVPVVVMPYDRHLAIEAAITPSRLDEATLVETTRLAAQTLARARTL